MLVQGGRKKWRLGWILLLHHWLDPVLQLDAAWPKYYPTVEVKFRCGKAGSLSQKTGCGHMLISKLTGLDPGTTVSTALTTHISSLLVQIWISHTHG